MEFYNTLKPYKVIPFKGIRYTVCRDYSHISRYRGLRQVAFYPPDVPQFIAFETPNGIVVDNLRVHYHTVTVSEENRLDLIAYSELGSASYAWVIAYINQITDGFTAPEGQRLMIPESISALFAKGQLLASISPSVLNLGTE